MPGAYWALMTHPGTSTALRHRAFGDVHMLSHLVGAANRADIRRLVALERDNAELRNQVDDLQTRVVDASADRDAQVGKLQAELAEARGQISRLAEDRCNGAVGSDAAASVVAEIAARLERESRLRHQTELALETNAGSLSDALGRLGRAPATIEALQQEVRALEAELATAADPAPASPEGAPAGSPLDVRLHGVRILYVGGRPSTLTPIRRIVEHAGGEWLHHDGGLEDRKGLLAAMLPRAQFVVFPIDCVDHDSMQQLKRLCARQGVPYRPLRTSSVASFAAALSTVDDNAPLVNGAALASRFCVRHG